MRRTLHDFSPHFTWRALQGTESAISGAAAGLVSAIITCPLDVVKTKLQAQGASSKKYKGLVGTITVILQEEGAKGLYRGLGPTLIAYLFSWTVYFTIYDKVKAVMTEKRHSHEEDLITHITAAMTAGATGTTVTNPLWVVKTRFMTQRISDANQIRYRHTWDAMQRIYAKEGFYGFYRGLLPSLFGVTHVAVQFPLYEHLKKLNRPADGSDIPPHVILACSSSSKMVASCATYPHEVLRTRLQIQYQTPNVSPAPSTLAPILGHPDPITPGPAIATHSAKPARTGQFSSIATLCRGIWREEGLAGFYRGLSVNLIRTVPSSALTILTYEVMMRNLTLLTGTAAPSTPR